VVQPFRRSAKTSGKNLAKRLAKSWRNVCDFSITTGSPVGYLINNNNSNNNNVNNNNSFNNLVRPGFLNRNNSNEMAEEGLGFNSFGVLSQWIEFFVFRMIFSQPVIFSIFECLL
jgi:hypothetical protein